MIICYSLSEVLFAFLPHRLNVGCRNVLPLLPLTVTIGGQPATVTFYGEAPGMVSGVMQVNAQVPRALPTGGLPLVVSLGGVTSQDSITVAVR